MKKNNIIILLLLLVLYSCSSSQDTHPVVSSEEKKIRDTLSIVSKKPLTKVHKKGNYFTYFQTFVDSMATINHIQLWYDELFQAIHLKAKKKFSLAMMERFLHDNVVISDFHGALLLDSLNILKMHKDFCVRICFITPGTWFAVRQTIPSIRDNALLMPTMFASKEIAIVTLFGLIESLDSQALLYPSDAWFTKRAQILEAEYNLLLFLVPRIGSIERFYGDWKKLEMDQLHREIEKTFANQELLFFDLVKLKQLITFKVLTRLNLNNPVRISSVIRKIFNDYQPCFQGSSLVIR